VNGEEGKEIGQVFDITKLNLDPLSMLRTFWLDILTRASGSTLYFHNWSGYDAFLSLEALLSLGEQGFILRPQIQNGKVICLTIHKAAKIVLTIKDSLKVLPGALGKLARDFKVPTQKEHLPHYFNP
jgi:hypothetical protein